MPSFLDPIGPDIAQSCSTVTPLTIAPARLLSVEFSDNRLLFPTWGVFPAQEMNPYLPLAGGFFYHRATHPTGHCFLKNRYTGSSASRTLLSSFSGDILTPERRLCQAKKGRAPQSCTCLYPKELSAMMEMRGSEGSSMVWLLYIRNMISVMEEF